MRYRCKRCKDVIESKYRHDMQWCRCGAIAVDGGKDYFRGIGDPTLFERVEDEPPLRESEGHPEIG